MLRIKKKKEYRVRLFEKDEKKFIVLEIDFLFQTIASGLDYDDLDHFWPPRSPLGPWRAYVGFRWACGNQIYQFTRGTIFGPEMSFFGPN